MTIKIYTNPTNQPEFILTQVALFEQFLDRSVEPWDYVVLSHAGNPDVTREIDTVCRGVGVHHEVLDKASLSWINNVDHSIAMQETYDGWCVKDDGIDLIIHNDMFLFKPTDLRGFLDGAHVSAVYQERGNKKVEYLSSHMLLMNMKTLPRKDKLDMGCGVIEGEHVDVCGQTHHWLKETPDAKVKWMTLEWLSDPATREKYLQGDLLRDYDPTWSCEVLAERFLHYARGTNWDKQPESWVRAKREWFGRWVKEQAR